MLPTRSTRKSGATWKLNVKHLPELMYATMQTKFNDFPCYYRIPAHGAGSIMCKNFKRMRQLAQHRPRPRKVNWLFKKQSKQEFMATLLDGKPFIPFLFGFNVDINKKGAESLTPAFRARSFRKEHSARGLLSMSWWRYFKKGHLLGSIQYSVERNW